VTSAEGEEEREEEEEEWNGDGGDCGGLFEGGEV
jgi:hypothetical protein